MSLYAQKPTFEWVKQIGGNNTDVASTIATDLNGNLLVAGHFSGTADLDPGESPANFISNGYTVAFKNEQTKVSIRLFSITGQVLMEDQFYNTKKIPLEIHQPNGLYFLEIIDQQAKKTVMKIVKD